jgi:peptidoglycan/LPS O-acetylase OafA/YrhL
MLAALACMSDYFSGHTSYLAMYSDSWLLVALMLFGVSFAMLLPRIDTLNAPPWMGRLGSYSYTLYILHFPVLLFAFFVLFNLLPDTLQAARWSIASLMAGIVWGIAKLAGRFLEDQRLQRSVLASWSARLTTKRKAPLKHGRTSSLEPSAG